MKESIKLMIDQQQDLEIQMDVRKTLRELWINKKNLQNLAICSYLWFATILQYQITLSY